jgi:lipopolysaccharide/colanic/teichoic acid biosynthesis glycosyltransferase
VHFAWFRAFPKLPFVNALYFFITGGKNRDLSKAEVWGRLSFCGFRVRAEEVVGGTRFVAAQRVAPPITNKRPSYYPVVRLTKVGLDGTLLSTHKVRSMYPYSEFLQKQIFEEHGLVGTGKFKNDFRLTEYGRWLRRYWIDEVPQIYDWLRGDIKLSGLRATSPHYLSLYPREFVELYIRVKPGLVPPLFNESTQGFDQVVAVEMDYLESYQTSPTLTDWRVLWATFQDIVFRGVRSK